MKDESREIIIMFYHTIWSFNDLEKTRQFVGKEESIVGKGENAGSQHFSHVFSYHSVKFFVCFQVG